MSQLSTGMIGSYITVTAIKQSRTLRDMLQENNIIRQQLQEAEKFQKQLHKTLNTGINSQPDILTTVQTLVRFKENFKIGSDKRAMDTHLAAAQKLITDLQTQNAQLQLDLKQATSKKPDTDAVQLATLSRLSSQNQLKIQKQSAQIQQQAAELK